MKASALPVQLDLSLKRGAAASLTFTFTDAAGVAVSIAADDIHLTVRESLGAAATKLHKTSAAGSHTNGAGGICTFDLTAAELTPAGEGVTTLVTWVYEVRRIVGGGSGTPYVWFEGAFVLHPGVGQGS